MSNKFNIPDINKKIDNCQRKINCDKYTSSIRQSACQKLKNDLTKIFDRKDIVLGNYTIPLVKEYFNNFNGCSGPWVDQCVETHGQYVNIYKNLVAIDRDLDDLGDDIDIIETLENNLRDVVTKELNDKLLDPTIDPIFDPIHNNRVKIRCTGESSSTFCTNIIKYLYMSDAGGCTEWPESNKIIANSANKIDPYHSKRSARKNYLDSFFKTSIYVDRYSAEFYVTVPYNNYHY